MRMSPILGSNMRGSVGGLTFTANQFQSTIVRLRVSPVNPNTAKQTAARTAFDGAVASWKTISQAFRDGWNDYAAGLVFSGPNGPYSISGRLAFIEVIQPALFLKDQVGVPAVVDLDPPILTGFLNIENVVPALFTLPADDGVALSFTQNGSEDVIAYSQVSRAFDPDRERFKGPFESDTLTDLTVVAPASGIIQFGGLNVGQRYFMNPRFITALAPFRISSRSFLDQIAINVI